MSKKLQGLKYMLIDELEQFADKGNISGGDLDPIYKLSGAAKRIAKLCEMEDGGYSGRYYSGDNSYHDGSYSDGGSYRGGSYRNAYDNGMSSRRDSRGRYSRSGSMQEHLRQMMEEATDPREREQIQRFMEDMR